MKTYDRESWWQECRRARPDLDRTDFDRRWDFFWAMVSILTGRDIPR